MAAERSLMVPLGSASRLDTRYRRGAAVAALAFPLTFAVILIVGLARNGLTGLSTHPLFAASLPTGLAAMWLWVKRYCGAAITALRDTGEPIAVREDSVDFFGRTLPLSQASTLLVEGSRVSLLNNGHVLAVEPTFFVRSDALSLNT